MLQLLLLLLLLCVPARLLVGYRTAEIDIASPLTFSPSPLPVPAERKKGLSRDVPLAAGPEAGPFAGYGPITARARRSGGAFWCVTE